MDKTRDVRRVKASRFSSANRQIIKQSGLDCEKLKGEKVRRLSFLGRVSSNNQDCEMVCVQSDEEDEFRPTTSISKRFKLPKKFFDDCNTVDHASVPRKLRSAIKKRSRESVSPPFPYSRKLKYTVNGVELLRKDGMKKSKLKQLKESEGEQAIVGPISKDEEEVVETLYALAGMFPDTDKREKIDLDGKPSSALRGPESSITVFEVLGEEKDSNTTFPTADAKAARLSSHIEGSAGETLKLQFSNRGPELDLHKSKEFPMELDNYIPKVNQPTSSLFCKCIPATEKRSCNSVISNLSELSVRAGSNEPMHNGNLASGRTPEIAIESAAAFRSQHEQQSTIKENKSNGSALWPGLPSTGLHSTEMRGPSSKISAAKLPAWLGNATCTAGPCSSGTVVLTEKDSRAPIDAKKSWKKCSAHVYISRLIKVLQITNREDRLPLQPTQLTIDEGSKHGALLAANKLHGMIKNGLSEVVSANAISCSGAEKSPNEVGNAILLHKRLLEDQQQSSTIAGPPASHKQSFDFLSLSAGSCGVAGNGLEPSTQFHVPYLHSLAHNQTLMPLSQPQNHYASTSFLDRPSAASAQKVQIQLAPYLGNSVSGTSPSSMAVFPKQQQLQQQQWFWAAQYKPGEVAAAHRQNWQNGRQDSPSIMQYAQPILPSSHSTLEVLGPRYFPILPQQQLISNTSLLPQTRIRRHHHQLPSGHGGNGGVFHPDSASSLQLLCKEHL